MNKIYIVKSRCVGDDYDVDEPGEYDLDGYFSTRDLAEMFIIKRNELKPGCYNHIIVDDIIINDTSFLDCLNQNGNIVYTGVING